MRQQLALFLECHDLKRLHNTSLDVLFEFLRGELKRNRLWKFILISKHIWNQYGIGVPRSVDRMDGTYAEKTQYLHESERTLAESLKEALEFRVATITSTPMKDMDTWHQLKELMEVNSDMLDPHVHTLTYWIVYGNSMPDGADLENGDGGLIFKYKGYAVQVAGEEFVTKCIIPQCFNAR